MVMLPIREFCNITIGNVITVMLWKSWSHNITTGNVTMVTLRIHNITSGNVTRDIDILRYVMLPVVTLPLVMLWNPINL